MSAGNADDASHLADVQLLAARLVSELAQQDSGLDLAIVGCGYWGAKHVRVLSTANGVRTITLIEPNIALIRKLRRAFPAATICDGLEEALAHVDAVVIATPPQSHAELALTALRAGKHVLVEKPLATSLRQAQLVVEQARRSSAVLMVGHTFQFNPALRELRRRMRAGELGQIHYAHCARLNLGLYRSDVNVIWDLAPHDISILNFLLNSTPAAVGAWGASLTFGGVEDVAHIRLEYEDPSVTGYVHLSWLHPRKTRTVTVVGSKKMAVYDDLAEEPLRIFDRGVDHEDYAPLHERPPLYRFGDIVAPHIRGDEPLAIQDQHFIDCILEKTQPESTGEQALGIIAALEAIQRSIHQRSSVPVNIVASCTLPDEVAPNAVRSLAHEGVAELQL
ncbi:MAG: Gfo/Idh/MocA family oxidoreductase [Acetobacteraceae bacterium]|nr:Gfo/Idh/MocA family oxidoreductase [Acetobacteraceae bacterium]MBV8573915.1 Gfo/Idh/MocA family oxidoreductase [Acetobacteraceae bacterium]